MRSLDEWAKGEGIDFQDEEAESKYKERTRRVVDAINLETPDRIPVWIGGGFLPANYYGISFEEAMNDGEELGKAFRKFVFDFEPDINPTSPKLIPSAKMLETLGNKTLIWPGDGGSPDAPYQFNESERMKEGEYEEFLEDPSLFWLRKVAPRMFDELEALDKLPTLSTTAGLPSNIVPGVLPFGSNELQKSLEKLQIAGKQAQEWQSIVGEFEEEIRRAGFPSFTGGTTYAPFDFLGDHLRGTKGVMIDMKRKPDRVLEAVETLTPLLIRKGVESAEASGRPVIYIPLHKGSDSFMSDEQYRRFYWPTLEKLLEGLIDKGILPYVFAEGKYDARLDVIKENHPQGRAIWKFDRVDMKTAKEKIGDNVTIMGNVHTSLLKTQSPEDVRAYCNELIEDVGPAGFILHPSANLGKADPENIQAMLNSVK